MASVPSTSSASDVFASINAANGVGSKSSSTTQEAQDRFLTLLVTQLKNQDPLNPMDNSQMTSQLAQISTVSGIDKLNATLNSLVGSLGTSQSMQTAEMIGKNVLVPGNQMTLSKEAAYAGIKLSDAADQVTVKILDSTGKVIHTQKLGEQEAGVFNVGWDGTTDSGTKAADGTYRFTVEATQGGKDVNVAALQIGTVSALVRSNNGFRLDLGSLGTFDFADVQQIL